MVAMTDDRASLEDLVAGVGVAGVDPASDVIVVAVDWHGSQAITLTYRSPDGRLSERMLYRSDEGTFSITEGRGRRWSFDGDARLFRLAAEAWRIRLAHLFDPYVALTSSVVRPLPHQIEAVYRHMLPRQPLRFLLADDPGAGKTIMAGLYIKELMIRGDIERCLVVAPGSLATQWQEELRDKFDLRFEIVTKAHLDALSSMNVFVEKPLLIARVDQLARRDEELFPLLAGLDWDLVVIDEAHRMSAHFYGDEIKRTKRFQLGEVLGTAARHLLLMTATPHNGKEEDFQLFLSLLDSDRFAGRFRDGVHKVDPTDLMRRMVKERLLTFEGKPLFPERRSYSVAYELAAEEMRLYDEVTEYVRQQMNAADRLRQEGDGRRGNTVGFALTILQRRLASSPEAIYQSLHRRRKRLEQRVVDERQAARAAQLGMTPQQDRLSRLLQGDPFATDADGLLDAFDIDAYDDLDEDEQADFDTEVFDAATAAATVAELEKEIGTLVQLENLAYQLRASGVDRKWQELSEMLSESTEMFTPSGQRRKLIVFTEHRDTLNYLVDRLRTFLGSDDAVVHISGGTSRDERRAIQHRFTQNSDVLVLVATDAAGEGINLQQAHLVINYDLPWNPNRIEQRFGRVHRIGQTEVCHMWNLVASETREAQVYLRLLAKIEQMRQTFKGQIYDVLGQALSGAELRGLLLDAIRYGDQPDVRDRLDQIIERDVPERVRAVIEDPILAPETIAFAQLERLRKEMEEAALRRLQPHYVEAFFRASFIELGGRLSEAEPGRFEIAKVPQSVIQRHRQAGSGSPLLESYTRVTFEPGLVEVEGSPVAELIAPGAPLLEAVVDVTLERHRHQLTAGTVLVDDADAGSDLRVLVMLEHEVADSRPNGSAPHTVISRRYEFVDLPVGAEPRSGGHAPYLDYRPPDVDESATIDDFLTDARQWLDQDLESLGLEYAIDVAVPAHLAQVRLRTDERVDQVRAAVHDRLTREISYWDNRAEQLQLKLAAGKTPKINVDAAVQRAERFAGRLGARMAELDQERSIKALPPRVVGGALIVPGGLLADLRVQRSVPDPVARKEVERRAIAAVLKLEGDAGWLAEDLNETQPNHPGYDVRSTRRMHDNTLESRYIEVKGRIAGSDTVTVSRNEILTSLNEPDRWVLALVSVDPRGSDEVRYVSRPFEGRNQEFLFDVTSVNFKWAALWERGEPPS